jgi:transposase
VKPYSIDLRERVLADCDGGMAAKDAAAKYRVSASWVRRLRQRRRETGAVAPGRPSPGRPVKLAPHEAGVREQVRADPDATLAELRARLGVPVSLSTLSAFLRRLGLTFKKKSSGRPSKTGRT